MRSAGWGSGFVIPGQREFWDGNEDAKQAEMGRWGGREEGIGGHLHQQAGTGDAALLFCIFDDARRRLCVA